MNEITTEIEKIFNDNKYKEALSLSLILVSEATLLSEFETKLIEKIFLKQSSLEFKLRLTFLEKLEKQNSINFSFLTQTLKQASINEKYKLYSIAKNSFLKNGRLEDLEKLFTELKGEFFKYNSYSPLLKEVTALEDLGIEKLLTKSEKIKIRYGLGDTRFFDEAFDNSITSEELPFDLNALGIFLSGEVWRKQRFAIKEKILLCRKLDHTDDAKEYLKGLYELLIVDEETPASLGLIINYCIKYQNKELATECLALLNSKYSIQCNEITSKINAIIHIEREEYEDIDLGEDLFNTEVSSEDVTINRLVKQICILRDEKDLDGATKLLRELRSLDEDHSLVRELQEKEHVELGSKVRKFKKTISEIETELLQEIGLYSTKIENDCEQRDHLMRVSKKYVELTSLEQLEIEYDHLVYTFNNFGFYNVSLLLIEKIIKTIDDDLEKELGLIYLKCETMRMSSNYYGALNEIETLLDERPLTDNEKISFYYLKGELLRSLGRKKEALKSYSKVYHLNKSFRMVMDRLKEIE